MRSERSPTWRPSASDSPPADSNLTGYTADSTLPNPIILITVKLPSVSEETHLRLLTDVASTATVIESPRLDHLAPPS